MPLVETSRADLESLLRARRLDRTLTTTLPAPDPHDEYAVAATGVTALDAIVGGGFPRGHLSEITGARSSGCASLIARMIAAAGGRGELVALVDALDMFDVASARTAGVDLDRLLWIRGHVVSYPGFCRDMNQRAMEQAIRAVALVLSAGNFGLVVLDAGEAPAEALKRLPFTTWLRLQRLIEGRQTVCVLIASEPVARSAAGLSVKLRRAEGGGRRAEGGGLKAEGGGLKAEGGGRRAEGGGRRAEGGGLRAEGGGLRAEGGGLKAEGGGLKAEGGGLKAEGGGLKAEGGGLKAEGRGLKAEGARFDARLFEGFDLEARVIRARSQAREEASVGLSTLAYVHD